MKTCPKCNRTFPDEGQKFCTFDGGLLIAPQTFDPNATMRATSIDLNAPSERPTSRDLPDPNATILESYPATVALPRNTGPTGAPTTVSSADTADFGQPAATPPPPSPPPPPAPAPPPLAAATPPPPPPVSQQLPGATTGPVSAPISAPTGPVGQQAPSAPLPPQAAPAKKSKLPWIIVGVLAFLLLGGGALAAAFFLVVKPRLDQMAAERNPRVVVEPNTNTATPAPTIEQPSPSPATTPADTFVPPPNTVEFASAKEGLQGSLAEHYFDFRFYYPDSWQRIQRPSTQNFVQVERHLPPDLTQENFVVGWYTSTGTFAGDLPSYPKRVEEFSATLAKTFPGYRKVSEGPTKVNSMDGYEFRWEGLSKMPERGDVHLWGRVIFVPTGKEGDTTGATLSMFTTSLAPELSSVEDVGAKGEAPVILDSFRFGKKN
jgi:hypothetical protein